MELRGGGKKERKYSQEENTTAAAGEGASRLRDAVHLLK